MSKILPILFMLLFSKIAYSQTPEELLEKTRVNYTPEKIYIHYDRQSYIAGDTIWFKAYIINGILPSKLSTVLNVELLNDSGKVISKKILPISESMAANAFELQNNLQQGSYTITAFTGLMMNFGTANFYHKQINIYNPNNVGIERKVSMNPEIKFFPESGNFVANAENSIAFKCVDNNGLPLSVVGKIVNSTGQVKGEFKSTHDGMGKFNLNPVLGDKYFAECLINGVANKTVALPDAILDASLIKLTFVNGKTYLELDNSNVTSDYKRPAYILGVEENLIAFKIALKENQIKTSVELPTSTLLSGILKITLFNKDNRPLAERLTFINSGDYEVKTELKVNNLNTEARKKNDFTFLVNDTTVGSYSVAITNADDEIDNMNGKENIVTRFLLTENLRGKINNPAYYFEKNDEIHAQNLDLVMLTNGWRGYNWTEILTNRFPEMVYKSDNYITIKGTAYALYSKKTLKETALSFYVNTKDSMPNIFTYDTDVNGNFSIPGILFEDTATFFVQNSTGKDKRINLEITSPSLSSIYAVSKKNIPYFNFVTPPTSQNLQIQKMLDLKNKQLDNIKLLDEIKVITKAKTATQALESKYFNNILGNESLRTLNFIATPPPVGINIFDYLRGRIPGVNIAGGPLDYTLNLRNTRSLLGGPIPMAVYLDNFQVEPSLVATMPANMIALVKVYSNGPLAGVGGALVLFTNKDANYKESLYTNLNEVSVEGFSITKEFYSPNYDVSFTNSTMETDNRNTLYWNPYLNADKNSKQINISFYNSDFAKKFKVVLQGFTKDGGLIHFEKIVQ